MLLLEELIQKLGANDTAMNADVEKKRQNEALNRSLFPEVEIIF